MNIPLDAAGMRDTADVLFTYGPFAFALVFLGIFFSLRKHRSSRKEQWVCLATGIVFAMFGSLHWYLSQGAEALVLKVVYQERGAQAFVDLDARLHSSDERIWYRAAPSVQTLPSGRDVVYELAFVSRNPPKAGDVIPLELMWEGGVIRNSQSLRLDYRGSHCTKFMLRKLPAVDAGPDDSEDHAFEIAPSDVTSCGQPQARHAFIDNFLGAAMAAPGPVAGGGTARPAVRDPAAIRIRQLEDRIGELEAENVRLRRQLNMPAPGPAIGHSTAVAAPTTSPVPATAAGDTQDSQSAASTPQAVRGKSGAPIELVYFAKEGDSPAIREVLGEQFAQITVGASRLDSSLSNSVWYGSDVREEDLGRLVNALVGRGVQIRQVQRFAPDGYKRNRIEIGHSARAAAFPLIEVAPNPGG